MNRYDAEFTALLLSQEEYRGFIACFVKDWAGRKTRGLTFAEISKRAGFASRSFPREVVKGSKRLTIRSVHRFAKGLGLSPEWSAYFKLLVALAEPDVNVEGWSPERIQQELKKASRLVLHSPGKIRKHSASRSLARRLFSIESSSQIYAALGTRDTGATLDEISRRTRLNPQRLQRALDELVDIGLVKRSAKTNRYIAESLHQVIELTGQESHVRDHFRRESERMRECARKQFGSPEQLFFHSSVSVDSGRLEELKAELRSLILKYVEQVESPEGDCVVDIVTSLYHSSPSKKS